MEQFNLNRHTYNDHLKEMMQHLFQSNESSDITLVCDDKEKFKAHKFVLNACSPIFQSIINDLPQKDSVIYLRGVLAPEMKSILQFMYLGQATFHQDRVDEFLNVARTLEIKELSRDVVYVGAGSSHNSNIDPKIEKSYGNKEINNLSNAQGEIEEMSTNSNSHSNEAIQNLCNKCGKQFSTRPNLLKHIKNAHEGIKYPCDECDHISNYNYNNLILHKRRWHSTYSQ